MAMIKKTVQKKAKFKVSQLKPIEHVDRCFIPAVFIHGRADDFIKPHHSEKLHEEYAGDKQLILVDGDHNTGRPSHVLETAATFLHRALQVDRECWLLLRCAVSGLSRVSACLFHMCHWLRVLLSVCHCLRVWLPLCHCLRMFVQVDPVCCPVTRAGRSDIDACHAPWLQQPPQQRVQNTTSSAADSKPVCRYGVKCYRTNQQHFVDFDHPWKKGYDADGLTY